MTVKEDSMEYFKREYTNLIIKYQNQGVWDAEEEIIQGLEEACKNIRASYEHEKTKILSPMEKIAKKIGERRKTFIPNMEIEERVPGIKWKGGKEGGWKKREKRY